MDYLVERIALYLGKTKVNDIRHHFNGVNIIIRVSVNNNESYIESWNEEAVGIAKPTDAQLESYSTEAQAMYVLDNARLQRVKEYPSIGDQLDALFHAGVFPDDMAAQIQAVKDKYPKE